MDRRDLLKITPIGLVASFFGFKYGECQKDFKTAKQIKTNTISMIDDIYVDDDGNLCFTRKEVEFYCKPRILPTIKINGV